MPGKRCAVAICSNNSAHTRKQGLQVTFHHFPKNEKLRKLWLLRCRRGDSFNLDTSCVCSDHFLPEDFEQNLQSELMNIPSKRYLKKEAVPSIGLQTNKKRIETAPSARNKRYEIRERRKVTKRLLQPTTIASPATVSDEFRDNLDVNFNLSQESWEEKYHNLFKEHQSCQKKFEHSENLIKNLKKKFLEALAALNQEKQKRESLEEVIQSFSSDKIDILTI